MMVTNSKAETDRLLEKLEAEVGTKANPKPLAPSLPLSSISTMPELFQVRGMDLSHIEDIARALREGNTVPPLLVLDASANSGAGSGQAEVGRKVVLIDGHHRLEAYRKAGIENVPVVAFKGTVVEAVLEACAANSITKLPMTMTERLDAAWRFVCLGRHSKAEIAKAAGCSTSTVGNMRVVLGRLGIEADRAGTWGDAMSMDRGRGREDQSEEEREEWIEATAQSYADTMAKTLGKKLAKNPEITARALAIHLGRKLPDVVRELLGGIPDEVQEAWRAEEEAESDY